MSDDRQAGKGTASPSIELDAPFDKQKRLWKCRPCGKQKALSTATWKSRTEREIPTFPQADHRGRSDEEDDEQETKGTDGNTRQRLDRRRPVSPDNSRVSEFR